MATRNSTLSLDGESIYVRQDGPRDAPALVLIHGLAGSTHWWDSVVPMLARSYRVIRIDLLGDGLSAKPAGGGYEITEQARRVGEALDRLGVKHAIVVGHSSGGLVATALAEQRPGMVLTAPATLRRSGQRPGWPHPPGETMVAWRAMADERGHARAGRRHGCGPGPAA